MSIRLLPDDVISQIKSSITITSLNGVVEELLKNSLDAGAAHVGISIDYARANCSVEDDGLGIRPEEFLENGGLCKLHYTSKHPPSEDLHGTRGVYLASLGTLSLLTITSHHFQFLSQHTLTTHNGALIARHTPALPEQRILRFRHGTRVTVRDLFGNMPVRAKQRPALSDRPALAKDLDRLVRSVASLLLAWPRAVQVTIHDGVLSQSVMLWAKDEDLRNVEGELVATCRVPRLLSQASFLDKVDFDSWVPISASAGKIVVDGFVCRLPAATRRNQFVSIGIRPIVGEYGGNILLDEINKVFINSSFGTEEEYGDRKYDGKSPKAKDGFFGRELKLRKGLDRWPMFYVKIGLGRSRGSLGISSVDDVLDERHKSLKSIVDLLQAMFFEFLKKHKFQPRPLNGPFSTTAKRQQQPTPSSPLAYSKDGVRSSSTDNNSPGAAVPGTPVASEKRNVASRRGTRQLLRARETSQPRSSSPFDSWPRAKTTSCSGFSAESDKNVREQGFSTKRLEIEPSRTSSDRSDPQTLVEEGVSDGTVGGHLPAPTLVPGGEEEEDAILWVDPSTLNASLVNARTGFVIRTAPSAKTQLPAQPGGARPRSPDLERREARDIEAGTKWLDKALAGWRNPAFAATEAAIPRLPDADVLGPDKAAKHSCKATGGVDDPSDLVSLGLRGRVAKAALAAAEVVGQVDGKFILIKVAAGAPPSSRAESASTHTPAGRPLLVLVDQHAADERCRLEELMASYFPPSEGAPSDDDDDDDAVAQPLSRPLAFDAVPREAALFDRFAPHFRRWGIIYEVGGEEAGQERVAGGRVTRSGSSLAARTAAGTATANPPPQESGRRQKIDGGRTRLRVTALPPAIVDRCRAEPKLLVELLRREVWRLEELGGGGSATTVAAQQPPPGLAGGEGSEEAEHAWVGRFLGCPAGVLDLLNSRACRGAVMFNDRLTREECVALVARLARCAFPFQCAHGRPAMVPLLDLGKSGVLGGAGADADYY